MTTENITADMVREMVTLSGKSHFVIHVCDFCQYRCGFIFDGDTVQYDNGCYCVKTPRTRVTDWDEVAEVANVQSRPSNRQSYLDDLKAPGVLEWRVVA